MGSCAFLFFFSSNGSESSPESRFDALHRCCASGDHWLFHAPVEFRHQSFRDLEFHTGGWTGIESAAAELLYDHPPARALSGLRRLGHPFCPGHGGLNQWTTRHLLASHRSPLDPGGLDFSPLWLNVRRDVGLRRTGLGRLLGLGSRGKCFIHALAHRHGLPALGDDHGKERNAQDLELCADFAGI